MNKTLIVNVGLLAIAIGAITNGLNAVYAHDYLAGGISIATGIIILLVYEKYPNTPNLPTS